jgi:hypothetical protein
MAQFKFDKSAIRRVANKAVADMAAKLARDLNALIPSHEGRPLDEVKRAVQDVWRRGSGGGEISDPELSQFAEAIASGQQVTVRSGGLK